MASVTKKKKVRKRLKKVGQASGRKNKTRRQGSTAPNLPLNKPNANEKAQAN